MLKKKVPAKVRKLEYPFVEELVREHDNLFDKIYLEKAQKYYYSLLTEAYAIRNFDVHAGQVNERAVVKLKRSLPRMVARLRWLIFDEIKNDPGATFELIIENLEKKARDLLTQ